MACADGLPLTTAKTAVLRLLDLAPSASSRYWRVAAAVLRVPLSDLCPDPLWQRHLPAVWGLAEVPPLGPSPGLIRPRHALRDQADRAAARVWEIMDARGLKVADVVRACQPLPAGVSVESLSASIRACRSTRACIVSITWPLIARGLSVPLAALCDDPDWIAAQPPLPAPDAEAEDILDDTTALDDDIEDEDDDLHPLHDDLDDGAEEEGPPPCHPPPTSSPMPSAPPAPPTASSPAATPAASIAPTPSLEPSPTSSSGLTTTRSSPEAGPAPLPPLAPTSPPPSPKSGASSPTPHAEASAIIERMAADMSDHIARRQPSMTPAEHDPVHGWMLERIPSPTLTADDRAALSLGRALLPLIRQRDAAQDAAIADALERAARAEAAAEEARAELGRIRTALRGL